MSTSLHNLLPRNQRKQLRRVYILRLITVVCVLITVGMIVGVGALLPAYLVGRSELNKAEELVATHVSSGDEEELLLSLEQLQETLDHLDSYKRSTQVTALVQEILEGRSNTIHIDSIAFDRTRNVLTCSGIANTRADLKKYEDWLRQLDTFASVSIPVEDYKNKVDLAFNVSLTLKEELYE